MAVCAYIYGVTWLLATFYWRSYFTEVVYMHGWYTALEHKFKVLTLKVAATSNPIFDIIFDHFFSAIAILCIRIFTFSNYFYSSFHCFSLFLFTQCQSCIKSLLMQIGHPAVLASHLKCLTCGEKKQPQAVIENASTKQRQRESLDIFLHNFSFFSPTSSARYQVSDCSYHWPTSSLKQCVCLISL